MNCFSLSCQEQTTTKTKQKTAYIIVSSDFILIDLIVLCDSFRHENKHKSIVFYNTSENTPHFQRM